MLKSSLLITNTLVEKISASDLCKNDEHNYLEVFFNGVSYSLDLFDAISFIGVLKSLSGFLSKLTFRISSNTGLSVCFFTLVFRFPLFDLSGRR